MSIDITPGEPPDPKVTQIDEDADKVLEIQLLQQGPVFCDKHCRNVWADDHRRVVICRDYGKVIEAYDYLKQWAHEGDRRNSALKGIIARTRIAQAQFADLERRINNLRASLKRMGRPQQDVERREYRQHLLGADSCRPEVVRGPIELLELFRTVKEIESKTSKERIKVTLDASIIAMRAVYQCAATGNVRCIEAVKQIERILK